MYLGSSMVEHFLPGWVHGVPVCQEALLCHIYHLSGSSVHGHGPLISQSCLLGLLLGLGEQTAVVEKKKKTLQKHNHIIYRDNKSIIKGCEQSGAGPFSRRLPSGTSIQIVDSMTVRIYSRQKIMHYKIG